MDFDLIFVVGTALLLFAIPSFVSAYSDRRWPRTAIFMVLVGGVAIAYAIQENPSVYSVAAVPDVVVTVLGRYLN